MTFADINVTQHLMTERADRVEEIRKTGGLGEPKRWLDSRQDKHIVHLMTSTDVILVVDKYTKTCLTLYKASEKQRHVFQKYGHAF